MPFASVFRAPLSAPESDPAAGGGAGGSSAATESPDPAGAAGGGGGDVERVLEALRKEREQKREIEAERNRIASQLRELQQGGHVDAKQMEEAQRRAEVLEKERQLLSAQLEQVRREAEGKFSETLEKVTAELNREKAERQQQAIRFAARDAFLAADGRTDGSADGVTAFDYFWSQFGGRFAKDEKGLYVTDRDGDPVLDSETGKRLDPVKWLTSLRDDPLHGMHFKGQYGSGGGSRSNRDGRAVAGVDISKLSTEAKFSAAFGRKR